MNETGEAPRDSFQPVSEALRARSSRSWLGDGWPRRDAGWLLLLTAVAAALRLWQLEAWSLSADEAQTWRAATETLAGGGGMFTSERSLYPLCHYGLRFLIDSGLLPFLGEGWLRLPFAFVGIVTVPLVAVVGDLFVGRRPALLAAGWLAIHPWHVQSSQTAAGPVVAVFAVVLAYGIACVAWRMRHGPSRWLAAVVAGLGGLAHPMGWCAALVLLLWVLAALRRDLTARLRAALVVALLGGAAVAVWWTMQRIGAPPVALAAVRDAAGGVAAAVGLLLAMLVAAFWLQPTVDSGNGGPGAAPVGALLALAIAAPLAAPFACAGLGVTPAAMHALPALPVLLWCGAAAACRCGQWLLAAAAPRGLPALAAAALLPAALGLGCLADTFLQATVQQGQRADWRGARDAALRALGREPRVTVLAAEGAASLCYYLRPNQWREPDSDPHPNLRLVEVDLRAAGLLPAVEQAGPGEVFVALTAAELAAARSDAAVAARLVRAFRLIEVLPGPLARRDATIYVWRRTPPA